MEDLWWNVRSSIWCHEMPFFSKMSSACLCSPKRKILQGLFNSTPNLSEICLGSNRLTEAIPDSATSLLKMGMLVLEKKTQAPCHLLCLIFPSFKHYLSDGTTSQVPFLEMRAFTSQCCKCWFSKNHFNKPIPLVLSTCQNLDTL